MVSQFAAKACIASLALLFAASMDVSGVSAQADAHAHAPYDEHRVMCSLHAGAGATASADLADLQYTLEVAAEISGWFNDADADQDSGLMGPASISVGVGGDNYEWVLPGTQQRATAQALAHATVSLGVPFDTDFATDYTTCVVDEDAADPALEILCILVPATCELDP